MALKSQKTSAPKTAGGGLTELRQRILFVLMVMVIFRAGSFVPVPGIDSTVLQTIMDQ